MKDELKEILNDSTLLEVEVEYLADKLETFLAPELEKARLWDEKCCPYGSHNLSTCWAKFGHDHYSKLPNETKCPQYTPDKVDGICTFIECSKRNADCIVNGLIKEPT